jgi:hypothetical protein
MIVENDRELYQLNTNALMENLIPCVIYYGIFCLCLIIIS